MRRHACSAAAKGESVKRPALLALISALLICGALTGLGPAAGAGASEPSRPSTFNALTYLRQHGYLPLRGVETLRRAKARAAATVAAWHHDSSAPAASAPSGPGIGAKWQGVYYPAVSPSDSNGAVGPKSYMEVVNVQVGIYKRDGTLISQAPFSTLTGHGGSDPMVLWDPDTQRFYYNILNVAASNMDWGFSKDSNPTSIPGSFCNYETSFGYPDRSIPDYPKLGQSKNFLMIGVNFYRTILDQMALHSDVLWIAKPKGSGAITKCPDAGSFKSGKIAKLKNEDGSQAFTPVAAIQTDPSGYGYVVAMSDIECPPICGKGTLLTLYTLKPSKSDPRVPTLTPPQSVTVGAYKSPPDAPQKGTDNLLDTLDGRLTHAVSGIDPKVGKTTVWVSHTVLGGAGSEVRWYELLPGTNPKVIQSGAVSDAKLYVFNGGISTDRTVNASGKAAHGSAMVLGFNTSSSSAYPAIQMVSKTGSHSQSAFVMVEQATTFHTDFTCKPTCRWGDYSGATPDPAADLSSAKGEAWLTCQLTIGTRWNTWNWEAKP
jgi:hypothetical protein